MTEPVVTAGVADALAITNNAEKVAETAAAPVTVSEVATQAISPSPTPADAAKAILSEGQAMFGEAESRSKRASRINRNIFIVTTAILTFFIICRLYLLWQITQNRKKLARENSLES